MQWDKLASQAGAENIDLVIGAPYTLLATAVESKPSAVFDRFAKCSLGGHGSFYR